MPPKKLAERKRTTLTPQSILDAALRVASRTGAGGLTVRALGDELGADPTAIYRHFRDKDEIILELVDLLASEAMRDRPTGIGWQEGLRYVGRHTVNVFLAHPAIGEFAAVRVSRRHGEFGAVEALFSLFIEAGLAPADAAVYTRAFGDSILSYAGMRAAQLLMDPRTHERDEQAWARDYQVLPAETYPTLAAHARHLIGVDDDLILETIIDSFLAGVERRLGGDRSVTQPARRPQ